jgi:uncharacterized membrane protein YedE/YeeE
VFGLARFSTLLVALLIASPALYGAFVKHTLDPMSAFIRLLIAVPVAAVMLAVLRLITGGYGRDKQQSPSGPQPAIRAEAITGEPMTRRISDLTPPPGEE